MRKFLCPLLGLFILISTAAAEVDLSAVQDTYSIVGRAALVWNLTEEDEKVAENFSDSTADLLKLQLFPDEYGTSCFAIVVPILNLENDYTWFLIDKTGALVGNIEYAFMQCSCGESAWYDVIVHLAPNYIKGGEFYLVFVEK